MAKEIKKIGLNELELTNDDIFVRKTVTDFGKDDVVIVHETHSAMLLKDGKLQDTLEAGRYPLFEIQKKFFGLVKAGPKEASAVNKRLASFLKKVKI